MLELWAAISVDHRFWTQQVLPDKPVVWELGIRRLEVSFRADNPPASYAVARVGDAGVAPSEFKRMYFSLNNRVGEFLVRIYRTEQAAQAGRDDFARPIDGSRDL